MTLQSLFFAFLRIGLTSFGMPAILQNVQTYAVRQGVVTAEEFDEGLALVQLYPGPIMANLVTYIGYRRQGNAGALIATVGFLIPSLLAMLAAAAMFQHYGALGGAKALLWSLNAVVVGTVLNITLDHAKKHVVRRVDILLALLAAVIALCGINLLWAVAAGFFVGAGTQRHLAASSSAAPLVPFRISRFTIPVAACVGVLSAAAWSWMHRSPLNDVTAEFMKIGTIAFGNGYTILPMIQKTAVVEHHWLSASQLGAAISLGQFTPGPILNVATFTGYFAAGIAGALAASAAIYAPSFGMTLVFAEAYQRFRHIAWTRGAISGVLTAFVGLLVMVLIRLGEHALTGPFAAGVAASSFVALRYLKWSLPVIYGVVGIAVFAWNSMT